MFVLVLGFEQTCHSDPKNPPFLFSVKKVSSRRSRKLLAKGTILAVLTALPFKN